MRAREHGLASINDVFGLFENIIYSDVYLFAI